jgi:nickel-type superoxide dismutase maturation protease
MTRRQRYHGPGIRWVGAGLGLAAVVAWVRWRPFRVAVEGESMAPGLQPGDWLVATRRGSLRRGALVVVEHPMRPDFEMVKLLYGMPGDEVEGRRLGPDEYWVVGVNARASTDSRSFGPVARRSIVGVVRMRAGSSTLSGRMSRRAG